MPFTELAARLRLDSSGFTAGVDEARRSLGSLEDSAQDVGRRMQRAGAAMTAGITAPLAAISVASVRTASDVEEMQSKMNVVFEDLTGDVKEWSREHGNAVNRSAIQLQEYATSLQDTFVPMGIARDEAAEMSKEMTELAVDLASFNNMAESDAIRKLESGLMGQHRALRDFGVAINQSRLEQELLNEGMAESVQEASEQEKMMARMNIIMRDTADAQGDAARTSESFANRMRGLKADTEQLRAEIGQHLIPVATSLVDVVSDGVSWFSELDSRTQKLIIVGGGLAAVLGPLIVVLGTIFASAATVAAGFGTMAAAASGLAGALTGGVIPAALATQVALGPVTLPLYAIVAAVGALVAAGYGLYRAWTSNLFGVRDATMNALDTVRGWFQAAPDWVLALLGPVGWLYSAWSNNLFGVRDVVGKVFDWIGSKIDWLRDQIDKIPGINMDEDDVDTSGLEKGLQNTADQAGQFGEETGQQYSEGLAKGLSGGLEGDSVDGVITQELVDAVGEDWIEENTKAHKGEAGLRLPEVTGDVLEDIAAEYGHVDPEMLGIRDEEFDALLDGSGTGSTSGSRAGSSGVATDTAGHGPPQSAGSRAQRSVTKDREMMQSAFLNALEEWSASAVLEMLLDVDDRELDRLIDDRMDARFRGVDV